MKAVIFDFNGTLFLDNDKHIKAWSAISRQLRSKDITEEELHTQMNGLPNYLIVRYLNGGKEDHELEEKYSRKKEELYRKFCLEDKENFHLIEGARELFDELKQKQIPFTIASASIKENIDFFVESFDLDHWINPDEIVFDDGTFQDKTAMFLKAAEYLHTPAEETTVIEDSLAGIKCSLNAGVQDIRIINSGNIENEIQDIPQIHQIVRTMNEIIR